MTKCDFKERDCCYCLFHNINKEKVIELKPFERYSDNHSDLPEKWIKTNVGAYHSEKRFKEV